MCVCVYTETSSERSIRGYVYMYECTEIKQQAEYVYVYVCVCTLSQVANGVYGGIYICMRVLRLSSRRSMYMCMCVYVH